MRLFKLLLASALALTLLPAVTAGADTLVDLSDAVSLAGPLDESNSSPNMRYIETVEWDFSLRDEERSTPDIAGGTDMEFATIDGRDYAFVGTYSNGFQVIDVTDPENASLVTTYHCDVLQGDVQVFTRDEDGVTKTYVTYAVEGGTSNRAASKCFADAGSAPEAGTIIIDVSVPAEPTAVAMIPIAGGTHNQTVHPEGNYLYNSNSGGCGNCIEVIDITDLDNISEVTKIDLGDDDSHDITFNADGTRAYTAALGHSAIINTEDPANPTIISRIDDPAVSLHHQLDPVKVGDREFVIINDELLGAGGNEVCPGGGLHVWEITGDMENEPQKVGAFFIPEVTVREGAGTGLGGLVTCTSHVFRIYEEQQKLVIGWFGAGVHVIDISGLAEAPVVAGAGALGVGVGMGMQEVGYYRFNDSDAWSAKVVEWDQDGSAYIFAADQTRGFDVFHYDNTAEVAEDPGTWLTPAGAQLRLDRLLASGFSPRQYLICDLTFGRALQ